MGSLPKPPAGDHHEDLHLVAARLEAERPTLDDAGMERVLRRVAPERVADRRLRRTRIAVTLSLVLGFCFSGAGAGLAISGIGGDGATSAARQYGAPTENSGTLGGTTSGTPAATPTTTAPTEPTPAAEEPAGGTAGEENSGTPSSGGSDEAAAAATAAAEPVQAARQLSTDSGETLPFTGWAALPVVALGLLLLGAGLVLRRRTA